MAEAKFSILLLNDANILEEHLEKRMEILHGCQFKNIHFLDRDTLWKRFDNGTSMALQMKEFDQKKIQIPSTESKVPL